MTVGTNDAENTRSLLLQFWPYAIVCSNDEACKVHLGNTNNAKRVWDWSNQCGCGRVEGQRVSLR